jgi:hypothetical protein
MPAGSKVDEIYQALRRKGYSEGKAARIAQSKSGESLKTGKPPKVQTDNETTGGSYPHLDRILGIIARDNDLTMKTQRQYPPYVSQLEAIARRLTPGEKETMAMGEDGDQRAMMQPYGRAGDALHNYLNEAFDGPHYQNIYNSHRPEGEPIGMAAEDLWGSFDPDQAARDQGLYTEDPREKQVKEPVVKLPPGMQEGVSRDPAYKDYPKTTVKQFVKMLRPGSNIISIAYSTNPKLLAKHRLTKEPIQQFHQKGVRNDSVGRFNIGIADPPAAWAEIDPEHKGVIRHPTTGREYLFLRPHVNPRTGRQIKESQRYHDLHKDIPLSPQERAILVEHLLAQKPGEKPDLFRNIPLESIRFMKARNATGPGGGWYQIVPEGFEASNKVGLSGFSPYGPGRIPKRPVATEVSPEGHVTYHQTQIITVNPDGSITLDHGGWQTRMTKARMNQYGAKHGIHVYQDKGDWHVAHHGVTTPYENGMTIHPSGHVTGLPVQTQSEHGQALLFPHDPNREDL